MTGQQFAWTFAYNEIGKKFATSQVYLLVGQWVGSTCGPRMLSMIAPTPVVQQGLAVEKTLVELVDFAVAPAHSLFEHDFSPLVAVNDQIIRRLPHVALFATDDRQPKERLMFGIGIDAESIAAFFPSGRHLGRSPRPTFP